MDLESLLTSGILYAGSEIADSSSTYFCVKKYVIEREGSEYTKDCMKEHFIGRALLVSSFWRVILVSGLAGASWAAKKILDIEMDSFPSPKHMIDICAYAKYYASVSNTSLLFGWNKLHKMLSTPFELVFKIKNNQQK